jgi:uncharacterized protein YkwD
MRVPGLRRGGGRVAVLALALAVAAPAVLAPEPPRAEAAACNGAKAGPTTISRGAAGRAVVCLINKRRRAHGMGGVKYRKPLRKAGRRHSVRMLNTRCMAHQCSGEKDLAGRIHDTRYLPCGCTWGVGETIAAMTSYRARPVNVVKAWMQSPGHRSVLLSRSFRHVGVGLVWGVPWAPNKRRSATYTADFGFKR